MQNEEPTLGQLIEKFLEPVKGREAQVSLIRFMTRHLNMGPDSVKGFPRIDKVRDEIRKHLSARLLEAVQIKTGDELTYFQRSFDGSWEPGKKCKVVRVTRFGLTLSDKGTIGTQFNPLSCQELLSQVGAEINFAELNEKALALKK